MFFIFFESVRGRDFFLSSEKRSFVVPLPVNIMHNYN